MSKLWGDHKVSSEAFEQVFEIMDANGSGGIDKKEMVEFLRKLAQIEDNVGKLDQYLT